MKILATALIGGSLVLAGTPALAVQNTHATRQPVLGSKAFDAPGSAGFGTYKPAGLFNGGDPNGFIGKIHWQDWSGPTAHGYGLNSIFKPHGGYYAKQVRIYLRPTDLGHCHPGSPLAYLKLFVREPKRPGGPLGPWVSWSGQQTLCGERP